MAKMNMIAALNSALAHQLERDPNVVIFGEDVGYFGGVFRVTAGLQEKFGPHRVFDSPLAEGGIAAIAMGMGLNGLRPVAEIQFWYQKRCSCLCHKRRRKLDVTAS